MNETTRAVLRRELESRLRAQVHAQADVQIQARNLDCAKQHAEETAKAIADLRAALGEQHLHDVAGSAAVHVTIAPGQIAHIHNA